MTMSIKKEGSETMFYFCIVSSRCSEPSAINRKEIPPKYDEFLSSETQSTALKDESCFHPVNVMLLAVKTC